MRTPLPRALLLDLDDTIIRYESTAESCWRGVCTEVANSVEASPDQLLQAIYQVRSWYWSDPERHRIGRADLGRATRLIVEQALTDLRSSNRDLAYHIADTFRQRRDDFVELFPGARESLQELCDRGVVLGLITNGTAAGQRAKIERFQLARFFSAILIEGECGMGKPDERIYGQALTALGVDASVAWMVGDNLEWDVATPQRLGIRGVWLDYAKRGLPADSPVRPNRIIHTLHDLLRQAGPPA